MPQQPFQRATQRMYAFGIDLNNPPDSVQPDFMPILENLRQYTKGVLQPRQGLSAVTTASALANQTPVHSVRRLNDPNSGNYQRIVGTGNTLVYGTGVLANYTQATYNTGNITYETVGTPLILLPYRPDQSPSSWMYVVNAQGHDINNAVGGVNVRRNIKIIGNNSQSLAVGTVHQIGVHPPFTPPVVELGAMAFGNQGIRFDTLGVAPNNWVRDAVVLTTAPGLINRIPSGATVTAAIYDTASVGWLSLVLPATTMSVLGVGSLLYVNNTVVVIPLVVHEVYPASASTTVGSILYDNSPTNTGACIIQPAAWLKEITRNCIVQLNGVTNVRVTDIIIGSDNNTSFKCSTGAATISATQTLQVLSSVRVYDTTGSIAATNVVADDSAAAGTGGAVTTGGAGTATNKTGWMQLTNSAGSDFTKISLTGGANIGQPIYDNDNCHLSFWMSDLSKLIQARILLDCDNTSLNISSTATDGGLIRVTTSTTHNLAAGDTVFIQNHNASTNGTWVVSSAGLGVTATAFDLTGSVFAANAGAVGTVRPQFKSNFFYRVFTPSDLVAASKGTQTGLDNASVIIGRREVNPPLIRRPPTDSDSDRLPPERRRELPLPVVGDPNAPPGGPPRSQTGTGDNQWSEVRFKRGTFVRVGSDMSRGFANVNAFRLEVTLTDTTAVTININSFTIWGTFEPDSGELAFPYVYRYRYRVSSTGAVSNWSPANRSGVLALREKISVTAVAPSNAPEVDKIDIQRFGGTSTNWLTIGTTPVGTLTYTDKMSDVAANAAAPFSDGNVHFQPWPRKDVPFSTTATTVVGTYIQTSLALPGTPSTGTTPGNLASGTPMRVNGINTAFRRVISAAQKIYEIEDSLGSLTNATVEIPEPTILGAPLPTLWGPYNGRFFACGDTVNPGTLYWTNGNDPDSTMDTNMLEITPTSEPLVNGCVFNGRCYVFSSERMFQIEEIIPGNFIYTEVPGRNGLFTRYGLAVGDRIWFLDKDGIYQTAGGDPVDISAKALKPLFATEGNQGVAVNGFNPPNITTGNITVGGVTRDASTFLRLSYYDDYLYFDYVDTALAYRTLVYRVRQEQPGWYPDVYTPGITFHYGEEGAGVHSLLTCGADATSGKLYQVTGTQDGTTAIAWHLRTMAFDGGDRRSEKRWADFVVDADPNNTTLTLVAGINNYGTTMTLNPATMTGNGRQQLIVDTYSGGDPAGVFGRNIQLDITGSSTTATPKLYLWEPSFTIRPETSDLRAIQWDDDGLAQDKFFQGIEIDADTGGVARTIQVEYDGSSANIGDTLTVTHTNRQQKAYSFHPAFIAHTVRLHPTDGANTWKLYNYKWVWQPEPPSADRWETQQTSLGAEQFLHMKAAYVMLRSTQSVVMTVTRAEDSTATNYTIASTAGQRQKVYVPFQSAASKGKGFIFTFSSTAAGGSFRLYKDDTTLLTKLWGSESEYSNRNPFGASHGQGQSAI